jgi:hypothetical protein
MLYVIGMDASAGSDRSHATVDAERQASAGARDGVKGKGAISLRALRCMR